MAFRQMKGKSQRIMLYEPGVRGHRPVILKYIESILVQYGLESISIKEDLFEKGYRVGFRRLQDEAVQQCCSLIHILTLDEHVRKLARMFPLWGGKSVPTVGTYYMFSNLQAYAKAPFWAAILNKFKIDAVMISDEKMNERPYPSIVKPRIHYLPDPHDIREEHKMDKAAAKRELGFKADEIVFLLFGEISGRKGADVALDALGKVTQPKVRLVLAGRFSERLNIVSQGRKRSDERLVTKNYAVPDSEMHLLYSAADYILCPYSTWFKVSSNTFTHGCAFGKPAIVPNHGVLREQVVEKGCGVVFESGNVGSLAARINECARVFGGAEYGRMCDAAAANAGARNLEHYGKCLLNVYEALAR